MESSHIPLHKWALAFRLMAGSKKGVSAHQLMRELGLGSYRTAWFLAHRVREAMRKVHETDIFVQGDFPSDVVVRVAEMAGDGVINPYASSKGKEISREFRTPASCRAASLR